MGVAGFVTGICIGKLAEQQWKHTDAAFAVSSPCGRQWWEVAEMQVIILHGWGLESTKEAALGGSQSAAKAGRCAVGLVHGIGA